MKVIGIICEYNPMHLGHIYQIKEVKKKFPDSIIIIVTCGCFTQRGDICIINKWDKSRIALYNEVDLVIELPFVYATQSADIFAKGSIALLNHLKVDTIVFGSESNDLNKLKKIVDIQLHDNNFNNKVKEYLDSGVNYPTALSSSLKDILGYSVIEPNDILAVSYIKEIISNNYNMNFISIKRTNNYHEKILGNSPIVNASLIREMFSRGEDISNFIADGSFNYLYPCLSMNLAFEYLKYKIISSDISIYQTVDEGIDNKLKREIINCSDIFELIMKVKSKRYTYNKITRMLLHILTNFTKEEAKNITIDYIRLLGFSKKGQMYLNSIKKDIDIPIITNYKKNVSKVLDIEFRINCIYSFMVKDKNIIEYEYSHKPVIYIE